VHSSKVALITGGSRGIGLGIALELARSGFDIIITGRRSRDDVASALELLSSSGVRSEYISSDISDAYARRALLGEVKNSFGRLDVLVNNAGIAPRQRTDILSATQESFDEIIATNLKGPFFLTQEIANWMIELRGQGLLERGCVINVGSISATVASTNRGDYCISKAGIGMATRLWAVRLAEFGIDVYEMRPGIIDTDMTLAVKEKYDALIHSDLLLEKRWGTPHDVGRVASLLARGELPYATGTVLSLDGGLTIPRL